MKNIAEAIKLIYPEIQGGFVFWHTQQDGTEWENPIDGLIWENTEFEKPTWEQIQEKSAIVSLAVAKASKKEEARLLRDFKMNEPTPSSGEAIVYVINGVERMFSVHPSEIPLVSAICERLSRNQTLGTTREWTDIHGERHPLTLALFRSLLDHMLVRDEVQYSFYNARIAAIDACSTVDQVESLILNDILGV